MISVDASRCTRCGRCIADCIVQVIQRGENDIQIVTGQRGLNAGNEIGAESFKRHEKHSFLDTSRKEW